MNRPIWLLFTIATLLFSQPIQVMIPDTQADSGAICLIPIMVDTVTGRDIIGVDITLSFDHQVLNPESVWVGNTVPSGWLLSFNRNIPDTLIIAMAGAYALAGAGSLCTLQFRVNGRPNDTTTIHFVRCLLNEGNVPCTTRDGIFTVNAVGINDNTAKKGWVNFSVSPNPFNHTTTISYNFPFTTKLRIAVYNHSGQEITTLLNGIQNPGWYSVKWNGKNNKGKTCPAGIYFYRLECQEYKATKKMVKME